MKTIYYPLYCTLMKSTLLYDDYGKPVYHYHMHIVALLAVEKQVLWSKRCKDKLLVGTVKETIQQISHSKKRKSPQTVDENSQPA